MANNNTDNVYTAYPQAPNNIGAGHPASPQELPASSGAAQAKRASASANDKKVK